MPSLTSNPYSTSARSTNIVVTMTSIVSYLRLSILSNMSTMNISIPVMIMIRVIMKLCLFQGRRRVPKAATFKRWLWLGLQLP